ncbi:FAD binding domain protein [Colletotrichum tofieldiae]|nr:FAD binding domain protein [Colletotrichum tofieldiae]
MVSKAVSEFSRRNCSFAIRSGGHSTAEGWANIDNGVLLATTNLSYINLGDDYVSVGPGLRWGAVYDFLDSHGLAVVGSRGAEVGVGGLALGGGVSHFTPERGLACDNIKGLQIVTAGGETVEANAESHADLWQALKGSQNMFGVVTRLDLYTFLSPQLHSVTSQIGMGSFDQLAAIYDDYIRVRSSDEDARHLAVGLTSYYVPFLGAPSLSLDLLSTKGKEEDSWVRNGTTVVQLPAPLARFEELPFSAPTENRGTMARFASGAPTPKLRYDLRTISFHSSIDMFKGMRHMFEEEIALVQKTDASFSGIIEWQLVTENAITQGVEKGGNILGLEGVGPFIVFTMANSWADASGDEAAHAAGQRVVERGESLARELGIYVPFLYANYAAKGQDVVGSYGEKNIAKLNQPRWKAITRRGLGLCALLVVEKPPESLASRSIDYDLVDAYV